MSDPCCENPLLSGPATNHTARQLGVRGFIALWRGEQPLVTDVGGDAETVVALVQQGRLEVDPHGQLVAVHGLAARPTPHRIEHHHRVVHTWCAFDAIGIPAALGIDAQAMTTCPTCNQELRVDLADGHPTGDSALRLWLPNSPCTHLVDDFCAHANLYCDDDHPTAAALGMGGTALTLAEAAELGRASWRDVATALEDT